MGRIFLLIFALYFSGCALPAATERMTVTDFTAGKPIGDRIFVKESTGGSVTLPFWKSNIPNDNFTDAVKESLLRSKSFSALSKEWGEDWGLEIEIKEVDQPLFGMSLTVVTDVKYLLYSRGKKVYEAEVRESGTAPWYECLIGFVRLKLANEHAAKANIKAFIEKLAKDKPTPVN